ncbi:hypothetical protein DB30_02157 [Enhygromyxa salina]|uniref:Uncharacterized protein n=1 Tax=Enhygromyxa salina TaxID=215803 RepID=A0A0C2DE57_9BACT|nr:hypothetical protein [Enhygromyxa salina]KIG17942.1 hypothetical protein DB30_02157 [Enhygromyxa salina]
MVGLGVGAFALYRWRAGKLDQEEAPAPALTEEPASPIQEPVSRGVWLPQTPEEFDDLRLTVRAFVRLAPNIEDHRRLVWLWHWRGTPYPTVDQPGEHPSHWQLAEIIRGLVDEARAEARPAATMPASAPKVATERAMSPDLTAFTCDIPTPGYFYRVRAADELVGEAGIVSSVLHEAALDAAARKGWPTHKAEARARKLAANLEAQAAYREMLSRGEWNAGQLEPLSEGALLWLPPVRRMSLMDRSRSRRVCVEPRAWPDGSSKLEPPPQLREIAAGCSPIDDSPGVSLLPEDVNTQFPAVSAAIMATIGADAPVISGSFRFCD